MPRKTSTTPTPSAPSRVVGIGGSAGGLEAYSLLLGALPVDTGLAFLLIPHLSAGHPSQLSEILSSRTALAVSEAEDGEALRPNHVHVLPPDRTMRIEEGCLRLEPRAARSGAPTVIDDCFASLAESWGPDAVGVVLSGTGSDGAAGLVRIRAAGGTTFAQAFASAAYDGMPRSAVEAGGVDFTLAPEEIARAIAADIEVGTAHPVTEEEAAPDDGDGPDPKLSDGDVEVVSTIIAKLQEATGVSFLHYKRPTLARRIARRAADLHLPDLPAYLNHLNTEPSEIRTLFSSVLIHVTEFFREPAMFQILSSTVMPALLAHRASGAPLRVWVVGCATGEEVYSTAIAFSEVGKHHRDPVEVKIFATDLSDHAISVARQGRYSASIGAKVSKERLERFFAPVEGGFLVSKQLRDMCVFARHDVTRDPPFARLDLVICRNLLIYLQAPLQRRVLQMFHYAIKPGGFLALGTAETVGGLDGLFAPLDRRHRCYLRRSGVAHSGATGWRSLNRANPVPSLQLPATAAPWSTAELRRAAADALFTGYPRGSVIVNQDLEVRHFQGTTAPFLEQGTGGPSVKLLKLAHPDLRVALGRLVRSAQQKHEVARRTVRIPDGQRSQDVTVTVLPVPTDEADREHYLVLFDAVPASREATPAAPDGDGSSDALELELAETKEYMQAVVEEQDQTYMELQATYEASLSTSEEFQSANEELESTKEEMQSVNEELTTVNEQLGQRNSELTLRTAQLNALLEGMDFPILLLTTNLTLDAYNHAAGEQLQLNRQMLGTSIAEAQLPLPLPSLRVLVERAASDGTLQEEQTEGPDHRWTAVRAWPTAAVDGTPPTVVVALVDISELKGETRRAEQARIFSETVVTAMREPLVVLDDQLRIVTCNDAFTAMLRGEREARAGVLLADISEGDWSIADLLTRLAGVIDTGSAFENYEVSLGQTGSHERCDYLLNARRINLPGDSEAFALLALDDVTRRQRFERQLAETNRLSAVGQLAGGIAHEINNQMTVVLGYGRFLGKSPRLSGEEQQDIDQITLAAGRAADIIRQLLVFSRRQPLTPVPIEMNTLVAAAQSLLERVLGANIALELRLEEDPGAVRVDHAQFHSVLVNLALNARDAMEEHGGRLVIETASVTVTDSSAPRPISAGVPPGRYVRLCVSDTGTGMDEATRSQIFEPFFTTKPPGRGTGLGLASVYGAVKQAGGFIWVESVVGEGTTFVIDLQRVAAPVVSMPVRPSTSIPPPPGNETILVVEDDDAVRRWLVRTLREQGYEVRQASGGDEALRAIDGDAEHQIELVLTDVVMPAMSGIRLMELLTARRADLPVALMSGHAYDELVARGLVDKGTEVLGKPFGPAEVSARIRGLLDARAD